MTPAAKVSVPVPVEADVVDEPIKRPLGLTCESSQVK